MDNKLALYWDYDQNTNKIQCKLCPQFCLIREDHLGLCHTRKNIKNELYAINYGEVTSIALDPIEKKPLYHFKPGSKILSIGTFGCNMRCSFCQNYTISQYQADSRYLTTDELIDMVSHVKDSIGIAFTYNEPLMWYEYILDMMKGIKDKRGDLDIILVTNGFINEEPLREILPYIDAMNIDLKAFNESFYKKICGAKLDPVLKTIEIASKECHVEVTTLMVTGENDSLDEIEKISKFLQKVDKNIPFHLSRYYPNYKMKNTPTNIEQIKKAEVIAKKYLNYVYIGNVGGIDLNTYCPKCGSLLIERRYQTKNMIQDLKCPKCNEEVNVIL